MDGLSANQLQHVPTDLTAVSLKYFVWECLSFEYCQQAIDSGTSLMLVPDVIAKDFYALVCSLHIASLVV